MPSKSWVRSAPREYLLENFRYNADTGELESKTEGPLKTSSNTRYTFARLAPGKWHYMHILVWIYHYGPVPEKMLLNAIDGNPHNTRIENLRIGTRSQISAAKKMHANNTTGYRGIEEVRSRFKACIRVSGKSMYLGTFNTPEAAHEAFRIAANKYFGEFAGPDTVEKRSP